MDLKQKLDNLKPVMGLPPGSQRSGFTRKDSSNLDSLGGKMLETPHGPCYRIRSSYHPSYSHGRAPLAPLAALESIDMSVLGRHRDLAGIDPARTIFLDTETTGLAGGSGTYAFLVGIGRFDGGRFLINQYLMQGFSQETALLWALEREWKDARYLVTYNGRTYDVPLLITRFILQRLPTLLGDLRHLDLLHVARRLFRRRIGSCSLTRVEAEVLGYHRHGDIPGSMIPGVYFDYLRDSNPNPLVPIIEHNGQDILALAALLAFLTGMFTREGQVDNGLDLLSLGALYQNSGRDRQAVAALARAREKEVSGDDRLELMERLGAALKKLEKFQEAEEVWVSMARQMIEPRVVPYEELAKLYEHRRKDFAAARAWVLKGLRRFEITAALYGDSSVHGEVESLKYRLTRLERKIKRQAESDGKNPEKSPTGIKAVAE
ncbi:ribonuclease H-like domain-containing protein [candidate division KSB1 bacterium]